MDIFNSIKAKVNELEADANSFYEKGNKAAGTRLRLGLQELKTLAQDCRNDVTAKKNA